MKCLLLVGAFLGNCLALEWGHSFSTEQLELENVRELFQSWRFFHSKTYSTTEVELRRFGNFQLNLKIIAESNDRYYAGLRKYFLAMNSFGDLSEDEFLEVYNSPNPDVESNREEALGFTTGESSLTGLKYGAIVDWAAAGYAMPVKSQQGCGSCYAFSLVGALECNYGITHGLKEHLLLSEQQVVDCSVSYGNLGCNGGWETKGWEYIRDKGGLCTGEKYPYNGTLGMCRESNCEVNGRYDGHYPPTYWGYVTPHTSERLAGELNMGCVPVSVDARSTAFAFYKGGVMTGECGTQLTHAVLAVGYGVMGGTEYWIVKNSWGSDWGEHGFAYICKNCGKNGEYGECGILMYPYWVRV